MRVISQDGAIDVPYDYFSLSMSGGKYKDVEVAYIYCHNLSSLNGTKLAEYSAKEKAVKAMEMLRKSYENNEFWHCMATTDTFNELMATLSDEKFKKATSEYFQFPQDDEIEV
nr:MAG TPA: hypothetical protein [Bacteriophage sp.]